MRTALVTGVSGGIGRACAVAFMQAGWRVVGIDKAEQQSPLPGLDFLKADLADAAALEGCLGQAAARAGRLDALVNNAAHQVCRPVYETELAQWEEVMAVNLRSIYLSVRSLGRAIVRGGSIVNVCSVHAAATSSNISAYAASKGGVLALTRALAVELASDGIRVNAVLPGAVDTQMLRDGLSRGHLKEGGMDEKLKALGARTPLGRVGRPEEIAQAVLFLADSDRSSFITGAGLVADGGALARLSTE